LLRKSASALLGHRCGVPYAILASSQLLPAKLGIMGLFNVFIVVPQLLVDRYRHDIEAVFSD
jgi:hypothetical protein